MARSGLKRHKGKLLPKCTPAEREMIAFGYPDLSSREVAFKFGVSQPYVQYLRSGKYKVPMRESPKSSRLPVAHSLVQLDMEMLRRAVPLLHNYCQRKMQLLTQGRSEISLEPLPEGDRHAKAADQRQPRVRKTVERPRQAAINPGLPALAAHRHQASREEHEPGRPDGPLLRD